MDVYNTSLITDVQYVAPLMAYFSLDHHPDSQVTSLDDGMKYLCLYLYLYLYLCLCLYLYLYLYKSMPNAIEM